MSPDTMAPSAAAAPPPALPTEIPRELDRWNWGAFFLNWIWGLGNRTYLALLMFVPFAGLIMIFVLGAKGSAWAWRNGNWRSVEHFRRVQRLWAIWGAVSWVAGGLLFAGLVFGASAALKASDSYKLALQRIQENPKAVAALGTPIEGGYPSGSVKTSGSSGSSDLNFTATGPKGSGDVVVSARKELNLWTLTKLRMRPTGSADVIDVLTDQAGPIRPSLGTVRLYLADEPRPAEASEKPTFPPSAPKLKVEASVEDARVGTRIGARWIAVRTISSGNDTVIGTVEVTIKDADSNSVSFTLSKPDAGWSVGDYRVDLMIDGAVVQSQAFAIAPK